MQQAVITDKFGRVLQDLRISVTDRCNFRCRYCMPREIFGKDFAFLPKEHLLTFEEIERLASTFLQLGVKKIRLTGGEPLLRKNIDELIERLASLEGLEDIGLTTNGVLLGKMADKLKAAGLKRVNVSLDALDDKTFMAINDSNFPSHPVIKSIQQAKDAGLVVKINMVVKKGMNDHEVLSMANFFKERGITLRFIEFMDVGQTNGWDFQHVVTKKELYEMIAKEHDLEPVEPDYIGEVAKRYRYKGTETEVGFITSVSESFCSSCTRARIAADGHFYTCLFAGTGFNLKDILREGISNEELKNTIINRWQKREDRYSDERTEETAKKRKKIEMSYIGG
ncbi:cyclic pyranopterin phosphate synthase [Gracilibacillus ureilyticus]|uniref:GTP 3',8-cyclase n=1 Tax=Gracilibacillus ureilyticus TaxID=531814 RepID=A0A1H9S0I2_9BACI|nr:GTP 3',8-cyclase MoaA [Gracilibacillus ureilyticus]SER78497.1 cyclic pyranopterin phosphate synthase [Gracilibacillus ureilyticus]